MEELDFSELKNIKEIQGNYIYLKNGGTIHSKGLNVSTQEELEMMDLKISQMLKKFLNKK